MPHIVLTEEQARALSVWMGPVEVRDPAGTVLGHLDGEAALIARVKHRRSEPPGPCYSGEQIHRRLEALQSEWDRTGGFDEAYMRAFLERLRAEDPPAYPPRGSVK